ncbi:MAG TPA: HutD family protein [Candidatus Acidoferrales bacterium]|jgi:environmental stress-induced protein Ves|nr:HutD family protein [Candidatus Acidoferrales bacterium]
MPIRVIRFADYVETPWKNGGGVTHEIARSDERGEPEWRISLATIDRDGPFSDFTGYDRTIVPLDGNGFDLSFDDGTVATLDRACVPFRFAGERKVECRLLRGRSHDLNALTLRTRWQHEILVLALSPSPAVVELPAPSFVFFTGAATAVCGHAIVDVHRRDTVAVDEPVRLELRAASEAFALTIRFTRRA